MFCYDVLSVSGEFGRSYHALDVCQLCGCNTAGVKGNDINCHKVCCVLL